MFLTLPSPTACREVNELLGAVPGVVERAASAARTVIEPLEVGQPLEEGQLK
jgi:hypothetical protein